MKTKEQNKQEVLDYLKKTSRHVFEKENASGEKTYLKVFFDGDDVKLLEDGKIKTLNVDGYVAFSSNAKCVIKHVLFLNKKIKAVRQTRYVKDQIQDM